MYSPCRASVFYHTQNGKMERTRRGTSSFHAMLYYILYNPFICINYSLVFMHVIISHTYPTIFQISYTLCILQFILICLNIDAVRKILTSLVRSFTLSLFYSSSNILLVSHSRTSTNHSHPPITDILQSLPRTYRSIQSITSFCP